MSSHLTNGDNASAGGGVIFPAKANYQIPKYVCRECGHVTRHEDATELRLAAKAHWDEKHAEVKA